MRLRPRDARFKVMPETAAPRPRGARLAAVSFWLAVVLLAVLLLYHLGRGWFFVRVEGTVHLSGYGLFSDRALVLRTLDIREGDRVAAGQAVAEVVPLDEGAGGEADSLRYRLQQLKQAWKLVKADAWGRLKQSPELLALLPESYIRERELAGAPVAKLFELAPVKPAVPWWRQVALASLAREMQRTEERLNHRVSFGRLTVPYPGRVVRIFKRAGDEVRPGELILRVQTGRCEVHAPVPWSQLAALSERPRVRLRLPDGSRWTAQVVRWTAAAAPYGDRRYLKRYFPGREEGWRFVLWPSEPDFPCARLDRGVIEVEFPRRFLPQWIVDLS